MKIEIEKMCNKIVKSDNFRECVKEELLIRVGKKYHFEDVGGKMIKKEIREIVKAEAKEIIKDLSENYYEINLKLAVEKELKGLTRHHLIELIEDRIK